MMQPKTEPHTASHFRLSRLKNLTALWPVIALCGLLLFNAFVLPSFFQFEFRDGNVYGSLIDVLNRSSIGVILAIGMTLVIATGGVDLSVGSVLAITGAVVATLLAKNEFSFFPAVLISLGVAVFAGAMNGLLVGWLKIEPVIATLVLMVSGRGIAKYIAGEQVISIPKTDDYAAFDYLGNGHLFGLPFPALFALTLSLATLLAVRKTSIGLLIESVGGNAAASRATGINDRAIKSIVYMFAGFCAGLAGLIDIAYINASDPVNAGVFTELDAIFAVLVGGTALTGGRFSLLGSVAGAVLLQTLMTTLYAYGVASDVAPIPKATVILIVCLLQSSKVRGWFSNRFFSDGRRGTVTLSDHPSEGAG